jgi:hypothetical protein
MPRLNAAKQQPPLVTINTSAPEPPAPPAVEKSSEEKSPSWFWDLLYSFQKDEWGKVYDVWLIRQADSRVPMAAGEKGYLDMFVEPINPQMIKAKYGGGKYRAILRKNSQLKTSHDFEIEGTPVYAVKERPANVGASTSAGNDGALIQQFIGVLRDELERSRQANTNGNGAGESATVTMMSSAAEKAMDLITKRVPENGSPTSSLREAVALIKELGVGAGQKSALGELLQILQPFMGILQPLLQKLLTPQDPATQLATFLTIFEKIDALRGGGGGDSGKPRDWKAIAVEKGLEALPSVLDQLRATQDTSLKAAEENRKRAEAQARTAEIVRTLPGPGQPAAPGSSQAVPQSAAPAPASAAPLTDSGLKTVRLSDARLDAGPADGFTGRDGNHVTISQPFTVHESPATSHDAEIDLKSEAYLRLVKRQVVYLVGMGQTGESIVDYLDGALPGFSEQLTSAAPEQVTLYMSLDPILAEATKDPRWQQILQEAREYLLEETAPASRVQ